MFNEEAIIRVPISHFDRLMTCCANQNKCLDNPDNCYCSKATSYNLRETIITKEYKDD